MGPAYYVIAILGCGEAEAPCEHVAVAPARYESAAACTAATEAAMAEHSDIPFPVVVAQCRKGDAASVKLMSGEVARPGAGESAPVRRASVRPAFASR